MGVCMLHQWVELVSEGRNDGRSEEDSRSLTGIESRCAARQRGTGGPVDSGVGRLCV